MSASDWVVEAEHLGRRFGTFTAVDDLTLRIARGETFGLLGPNGAGKSTTIKMLTTLLPPSSGTARVAGFDVVRESREARRHLGYVPQLISADGALTARENLRLSARLFGVSRGERNGRIEEALQFMDLAEFADRPARTYSGGMIRRLELAQAMLHRPDVLFLDEPTIGLDPVARVAVWERLKEVVVRWRTTVLITTHDMDEADHLCTRLAILHAGRIAAEGTPAELKQSVGPEATLDDVFRRYSGGSSLQGERYESTRQTRRSASRHG